MDIYKKKCDLIIVDMDKKYVPKDLKSLANNPYTMKKTLNKIKKQQKKIEKENNK
jgi:hypothetical protein